MRLIGLVSGPVWPVVHLRLCPLKASGAYQGLEYTADTCGGSQLGNYICGYLGGFGAHYGAYRRRFEVSLLAEILWPWFKMGMTSVAPRV